jgi:3-dehydroquinate dehydratase-2
MRKKINIAVIHGPNLNLLGEREPDIYGTLTLEELNGLIREFAEESGIAVDIVQSNHEGAIIDKIHEVRHHAHGIVINPGAFTHYSYAIYDALLACGLPAIEVHLSDINSREEFRRVSVIAGACRDRIIGRGWQGYIDACRILMDLVRDGK